MINQLAIKNFQSHKETILNFNAGVNVIVGTTDSGKSAIIRALRWVCTGVPRGDAFRSHWGGDTAVELTLSDNKVTRFKTNTENVYVLNDDTEFRAFGTDTPEEIRTALNLDESVNLQKQLDQPYLISETPGAVAQHFNRMAQLEKIDVGLKNIQSHIRTTEQTISSKGQELKTRQDKIETYNYLSDAQIRIGALEEKESEIKAKTIEFNSITAILTRLDTIEDNITKAKEPLQAEKQVVTLLKLYETKKIQVKEINAIQALKTSITAINEKIKKGKKYVRAEAAVCSIIDNQKAVAEDLKQYKRLQKFVIDLTGIENQIIGQNKLVVEQEKKYVLNMPEICPLCGGENCKH